MVRIQRHRDMFQSKSNEIEGSQANPSKSLEKLTLQIYHLEIWFKGHKNEKRLEREVVRVNVELLEAKEIANQGLLIQRLGDYYGALSKDFKDSKEFSKPSERKR